MKDSTVVVRLDPYQVNRAGRDCGGRFDPVVASGGSLWTNVCAAENAHIPVLRRADRVDLAGFGRLGQSEGKESLAKTVLPAVLIPLGITVLVVATTPRRPGETRFLRRRA